MFIKVIVFVENKPRSSKTTSFKYIYAEKAFSIDLDQSDAKRRREQQWIDGINRYQDKIPSQMNFFFVGKRPTEVKAEAWSKYDEIRSVRHANRKQISLRKIESNYFFEKLFLFIFKDTDYIVFMMMTVVITTIWQIVL